MVDFWTRLDELIARNSLVLDRPRGSRHPKYHEVTYPLDYGYQEGTSGGDGNEADVWRGTMEESSLVGIVCAVDVLKRDSEIKLLVGCTADEMDTILRFLNNNYMSAIVISRD
jgi:inorganic pyrophosphatase